MSRPLRPALVLAVLSGMCALVYQMAWIRELKLIFGFSTAASATVLAVFSAGLGFGAMVLGRKVDRRGQGLLIFAILEATIGVCAALTPVLIALVREAYVAIGGTLTLGMTLGTMVRFLLAAIVLALPTFCMGGTLPALVKALQDEHDDQRHTSALLYGVNTIGALLGCTLATFLLFEVFGNRHSIWLAATINLAVAYFAWRLHGLHKKSVYEQATVVLSTSARSSPMVWFVAAAAFVTGFIFYLMELVWYRMLSPLLGGSVYTFGLIVAVALAGIGIGGALYALTRNAVPKRLSVFAFTCLLEGALLLIPYALGEQFAITTNFLNTLRTFGFGGAIFSWTLILLVAVFPAALVSGFQFPLFFSLLGSGQHNLGRQVGFAYVFNTVGSLTGALVGGFILIPALSAPRCWQLAAGLLLAVGIATLVLSLRLERQKLALATPTLLAAAMIAMLLSTGPGALWRHGGIGADRGPKDITNPNDMRGWINLRGNSLLKEYEGVEIGLGIINNNGVSFFANGKSDGNSIMDRGTQIGASLLSAFFAPEARRSMVIGLGTGSSAGWLGAVPGMEHVDVFELEPKVVDFAKTYCEDVNHRYHENPKIKVHLGDARELLLTMKGSYDLILSEPSNPYRAGIANLYTKEFFEGVRDRLTEKGIFLQWVQGYEVDATVIAATLRTLREVFPHSEIWYTMQNDIAFLSSRQPIVHDVAAIRARMRDEFFQRGFVLTWGVGTAEGLLSHHIGNTKFTTEFASRLPPHWVNTDDQNFLEYGFARMLGKAPRSLLTAQIIEASMAAGTDLPAFRDDPAEPLNIDRVRELRAHDSPAGSNRIFVGPLSAEAAARAQAVNGLFDTATAAQIAEIWSRQKEPPRELFEFMAVGFAQAVQKGQVDPEILTGLRFNPVSQAYLRLAAAGHGGDENVIREAIGGLDKALHSFALDEVKIVAQAMDLLKHLASRHPTLTEQILALLKTPFAGYSQEVLRRNLMVSLAEKDPDPNTCRSFFESLEPHPLWSEEALASRQRCYCREPQSELCARALADGQEYQRNLILPLKHILPPPEKSVTGETDTNPADGRG